MEIDKLTETELIDLNRRIVQRLRFLQQARAHVHMLEFRIGERVSFRADNGREVVGVITRYNKKTVTVITPDGQRWNISPGFLRPATRKTEAHDVPANVVHLRPKEERAALPNEAPPPTAASQGTT